MSTPDSSHSLREVLLAELSWIQARRTALQQGEVAGDQRLPPTPDIDAWLPDSTEDSTKRDVFNLQQCSLHADLCGLAISGGGIRSATFALGVLQGLALWGLLPRFDYLSTVSGGGYIGAWFSAWIARSGFANVERQLIPSLSGGGQRSAPGDDAAVANGLERPKDSSLGDPPPILHSRANVPEIQHLRLYSNYLAPLRGLFSFDTWTLFAIYLRNLLLNQSVLALAMLLLFLLIRGVVEVFINAHQPTPITPWLYQAPATILLLLSLLTGILGTARLVPRLQRGDLPADGSAASSREPLHLKQQLRTYLLAAVFPWVVSAICLAILLVHNAPGSAVLKADLETGCPAPSHVWSLALVALTWLFVVVNAVVGWLAIGRSRQVLEASVVAGLVGGGLHSLGLHFLCRFTHLSDTWLPDQLEAPATGHWAANIAVACPPLTLACITITNFLLLGLCGSRLTELQREWWSRLNARLLQIAMVWLCLFGLAIHGTWLLHTAVDTAGAWIHLVAAGSVTWLMLLVAGLVFVTRNPQSSRLGSGGTAMLTSLLAPLFLLTIFLGLATAATVAFDRAERYHQLIRRTTFPNCAVSEVREHGISLAQIGLKNVVIPHWLLMIPLAAFVYALWRVSGDAVGVNTFSLQNMYCNRLVRCFLGASRIRVPDLTTNMDPDDDLPLSRLFPGSQLGGTDACLPPSHWGPVHLVNGALNRKPSNSPEGARAVAARHAETLQFLDRQAESFLFSPLYCGSASTGYSPTRDFAGNVTVGTAIAASGAAVSPNMGYHSSPAITALLTVFNFRLGSWFGNPRNAQTRGDTNPSGSAGLLLSELLGQTLGDSPYVYVSDGGHFENMGVYELIRRRCRFIVAIDSGTDPTSNDNLGRLVRQVRIDFGVGIELDMTPVTPGDDGLCPAHITVGRIHYGFTWNDKDRPIGPGEALDTIQEADPVYRREYNQGILIWIKNAITGDEPGDVLNYRAENPDFPYDPTLNQFFSEAQFESYRRLGIHSVTKQFQFPNGQRMALDLHTNHSTIAKYTTRELFESMYNAGQRLSPEQETLFSECHRQFNAWLSQLRGDVQLRWLADEIFGSTSQREFAAQQPRTPDQHRAERLMAAEMFALLDSTFLSLNLRRNWRHPRYSGWAGQFSAWGNSATLRRHWHGDPQANLPPLQTHCDPQVTQFVNVLFDRQPHSQTDSPQPHRDGADSPS